MITDLYKLARLLWPFITEDILKNKTLREFISQDKTTVILTGCLAVSFVAVAMLNRSNYHLHLQLQESQSSNVRLLSHLEVLTDTVNRQVTTIQDIRTRNTQLIDSVILVQRINSRYESWISSCNLTFDPTNEEPQACPVQRVVRPPSRPRPRPVEPEPTPPPPDPTPSPEKRRTFSEVVRDIFRRGDRDEEE